MKCPNCETTSRIRERDRFCHYCGFNLKSGSKQIKAEANGKTISNDESMAEPKEFKSIHIDLEKKIFLLNGKKMDGVSDVLLEGSGRKWSLGINRHEKYISPKQS